MPARELEPALHAAAAAEASLQEARAALKAEDYLKARQLVRDIPAGITQEIETMEAAAKKPARPIRRSR